MSLRILMLGTGDGLAPPVLAALAAAGHEVAALGVPATGAVLAWRPGSPRRVVLRPADVADLAASRGVRVAEVPRAGAWPALLDAARPDLVVVACWPWRLPAEVAAVPRLGAVNVHPSLLPRWRGPAPLFWQYHAGDERTGVSVHHVAPRLDAGPLVARSAVGLPDGIGMAEAERVLGAAAGGLLLPLLDGSALPARPQGHGATQQGWPVQADLVADPGWTARRAYRFVRLARALGPLRLETAAVTLCVADAVGLETAAGAPAEPLGPGLWRVRFADGALALRAHPL